jgi:ElaB/YqjD/DUF883 family membrane-anchored ribosome-binding protein
MAQGAEPTVEDLKAQLDTVRKDMRILADMARDRVGASAHELRSGAEMRAEHLSDEARRLLQDARARGEMAYGEAGEAIRRNPFAAVGIALAAGWLIGTMLRR